MSFDQFCNAYVVWTRQRLAETTDATEEAQQVAQQQWDDFREWLARPPADEALFVQMADGARMRLPRADFSSTEASAAAAYIAQREADRAG